MRRVLRVVIAIIALLLGLGVCAWLNGRIVTDQWEWSQWLWWIPTPIALAAAGLAAIVLAVRTFVLRGKAAALYFAVVCVALMTVYFACFEQRLFTAAAAHPEGVRIMHWNWTHSVPHNVDKHVDEFLELKPDIAFMTDGQRLRRRQPERDRLEPEWHVEGVSAFTIVSRWPVVRARPIVANDTTQVALVEIDMTEVVGRTMVFLLVDFPSELEIGRMTHMRRVHEMLAEADVPPVDAVLGDFNVTRGSASLRTLFPELHHAFSDGGHGYAASYYRPFPLFHIDHILLSPDIHATDYTLIDPGFGRHRIQLASIIVSGATAPAKSAP